VPWQPELFSGRALAQIWERRAERSKRRAERLTAVPYFDGLMSGEIDALIGSFAGEPELHHPVRGRIKGARDQGLGTNAEHHDPSPTLGPHVVTATLARSRPRPSVSKPAGPAATAAVATIGPMALAAPTVDAKYDWQELSRYPSASTYDR